MKHSLQLKLSQHLTLTPQLQQSIRLLQLSTLELNQEIEQALQENPLLEREEVGEGAVYPGAADALSRTRSEEPAASDDRADLELEGALEEVAGGTAGEQQQTGNQVDGETEPGADSVPRPGCRHRRTRTRCHVDPARCR